MAARERSQIMPPHPRALMWAEACALLQRAERLHRRFFHPSPVAGGAPRWEPPVDILETDHSCWIIVALPEVPRASLRVTVEDGILIVTARRELPASFRNAAVHRLELSFGLFERRVALPDDRLEIERQEFADGCLTLVLRKLP
jgi:HSP20 family protein